MYVRLIALFYGLHKRKYKQKSNSEYQIHRKVILAEKDHRMYYFTTLKNPNPQIEANKF